MGDNKEGKSQEENKIVLREKYHYAVMKLDTIVPMLSVPTPNDAYLSEDANSMALKDLLMKGYRWVRTDGDCAVFEKEVALSAHVLAE